MPWCSAASIARCAHPALAGAGPCGSRPAFRGLWRSTRLARIGLAEAVGTQGVPVEVRHACGASNTGRGLGWHEAVTPVFGLSNSPSPRARQSHCGVSGPPPNSASSSCRDRFPAPGVRPRKREQSCRSRVQLTSQLPWRGFVVARLADYREVVFFRSAAIVQLAVTCEIIGKRSTHQMLAPNPANILNHKPTVGRIPHRFSLAMNCSNRTE
jgi:hypothetical protein